MSRLVARILLSIFMFPVGGLFYIFVMMIGEEGLRGPYSYGREIATFLVSGILTWLVIALYWWLLWKSSIQWHSKRIANTLWATGAAILMGVFAGVICALIMSRSDGADFGTFMGGLITIVAWLIMTVFIWRETAKERTERVKKSNKSAITCPTCGYNLTGLSESRCPECGSKFTLDELMASQSSAEAEIE
jgi:DNA-directed RNA polymerase subunit RPC12/RpoP